MNSIDTIPLNTDAVIKGSVSVPRVSQQRPIARKLLAERGMTRLADLRAAGVTAATMTTMANDGEVARRPRGLYELADAELHAQHSLAEAAARPP